MILYNISVFSYVTVNVNVILVNFADLVMYSLSG